MAGNGNGNGNGAAPVTRIAQGVIGALLVSGIGAAIAFSYGAQGQMADIRIAQAQALGEVRLLSERIANLQKDYDELMRRVQELERRRP